MASELHEQEEIPWKPPIGLLPHETGGEELPEHHAPETADELESQRHDAVCPRPMEAPDPVDDPLDDEPRGR